MKIQFANANLKSIAEDSTFKMLEKYIKKKSAPHEPKDILKILNVLQSAENASAIPPMYNYHSLSYDYTGLAAVDIKAKKLKKGGRGAWRTIFEPISDCDNIQKETSIKEIKIIELLDNYHKR